MKINTSVATECDEITLDSILTKVTELDIYQRYVRNIQIGKIYNSPFRKDSNPSFGIFYSRSNGNLLFKDHGIGLTGNVITFVGQYYGLTNYNQILCKIIEDLNVTSLPTRDYTTLRKYKPSETIIGIVRQIFTKVDLDYWSTFAITEATLKKYNVFSCKYYLCNGIVKAIYRDDNPMFAYKVFNKFKIYRPLGDKFTKWRNNLTDYDIQGYKQLPDTGDLLIITKSLKDVMCLYEMGYNAISPSSESSFIPMEIVEQLKKRFKRILICFDRDVPGIRYVRKISLKTGLKCFLVHKKFKAKDISDAIKQNNKQAIGEWLKTTIT